MAAGKNSDHGQSIGLPSIKGAVTKWASGRITIQCTTRRQHYHEPGVTVELEISPRDARKLIEHLNSEVEPR